MRASHAAPASSSLPRSHSLLRFSTALTSICRTFMTKEATLCLTLVKYLLRFWPVSSSAKVLVFLSMLKDAIMFLATMGPMESSAVKELMARLRSCMGRYICPPASPRAPCLIDSWPLQSIKGHNPSRWVFSTIAFELVFNATQHS